MPKIQTLSVPTTNKASDLLTRNETYVADLNCTKSADFSSLQMYSSLRYAHFYNILGFSSSQLGFIMIPLCIGNPASKWGMW